MAVIAYRVIGGYVGLSRLKGHRLYTGGVGGRSPPAFCVLEVMGVMAVRAYSVMGVMKVVMSLEVTTIRCVAGPEVTTTLCVACLLAKVLMSGQFVVYVYTHIQQRIPPARL